MKILVTGGNGFIGMNLIKKLVKEGHEVFSIDDLSIGSKDYEVPGCYYLYKDVQYLMDTLVGGDMEICYHLAALSRIQPSFKDPGRTFNANAAAVQAVCEWCDLYDVKLIYAGSSSRWHDPLQSPYATYKKIGEDIIKMYKKVYNRNFHIARFYNVYGPGELVHKKWAAVIGLWRNLVRYNQPITIVGDGEQRRDFTHVDDIVEGLYRIGLSNETVEDAWELGTGTNYSINEVYEMFKERFGIEKVHIPDQKGNYRETQRHDDQALSLLGWKPKDRLKDYIRSLRD